MPHQTPEDVIERIIAAAATGRSYSDVGREFGVDHSTVSRHFHARYPEATKRGFNGLPPITDRVDVPLAQRLLDQGHNLTRVACMLGFNPTTLLSLEKRGLLRIKRSPGAEANRLTRSLKPKMTKSEWRDFITFRRAKYPLIDALKAVNRLDLIPEEKVQPRDGGPRGECDATMQPQPTSPQRRSEPCLSIAAL